MTTHDDSADLLTMTTQAGSSDRKVSMHMNDVFFGQMLAYHIVQ